MFKKTEPVMPDYTTSNYIVQFTNDFGDKTDQFYQICRELRIPLDLSSVYAEERRALLSFYARINEIDKEDIVSFMSTLSTFFEKAFKTGDEYAKRHIIFITRLNELFFPSSAHKRQLMFDSFITIIGSLHSISEAQCMTRSKNSIHHGEFYLRNYPALFNDIYKDNRFKDIPGILNERIYLNDQDISKKIFSKNFKFFASKSSDYKWVNDFWVLCQCFLALTPILLPWITTCAFLGLITLTLNIYLQVDMANEFNEEFSVLDDHGRAASATFIFNSLLTSLCIFAWSIATIYFALYSLPTNVIGLSAILFTFLLPLITYYSIYSYGKLSESLINNHTNQIESDFLKLTNDFIYNENPTGDAREQFNHSDYSLFANNLHGGNEGEESRYFLHNEVAKA